MNSSDDSEREQHLFVIRMWRDDAHAVWRSTVEHVGTGRRLSSTDLDEVGDFIRLRVPEADNAPSLANSTEGHAPP